MLQKILAASLLTVAFMAVPVSALGDDATDDIETFTCTTDVGAPFFAFTPPGGPNVGGCQLVTVTADHLDTDDTELVVDSLDTPLFCRIHSDDNADGFADRELSPDDTVAPGARIIAFCDAGVNLENSISLADPVDAA